MAGSLREAIEEVLDLIGSLGVEVNASSRVAQMAKVLTSRERITPEDSDFEIALEALRDIEQLRFALLQIKNDDEKDKCNGLLGRILSDPALPQDSGATTRGRDAQAELFVYAVCRRGGLQPELVEPDIRCSLDGVGFAVAVKRIKDVSQLTKRVRKGSKQILRSRLPGIVDIDVTVAMNPGNYRLVAEMPEAQLRNWSQGRLREIVHGNMRELQKAMEDKPVRGIMMHDHLVVWLRTERRWVARSMTYAVKNRANTNRGQFELELFTAGFLKGLPNLVW